MPSPAAKDEQPPHTLAPFQVEVIDLFVSTLKFLGIPRSVGEIYGLLFSTQEPLALDDIVQQLRLSKGSASQGMKLLRGLGAVKMIYVPGDRRDHFTAETELKKLVGGFFREEVAPRVTTGESSLAQLESVANASDDPELLAFNKDRHRKLAQWHRKATALFPLIETLLEE